jgi:hypothetical protein
MIKRTGIQPWIIAISAALLMVGLLIYALPVVAAPLAQTGTPIRYGDTVSGEVTEETPCQLYWFEGNAGDPVTIDLTRTSGDLDGNLALYQRDGDNFSADALASNDDRPGGGLDPLINFTLPAADWYTIAACRLQAERMRVTTGTFSLTLTGPSAPTSAITPTPGLNLSDTIFGSASAKPTPEPTAAGLLSDALGGNHAENAPEENAALADGSVVTGQLGAGTGENRYDLPVRAGDQVMLEWRAVSGELPPLLRVTDPGGAVLAEASTPEAVEYLYLTFRAPGDAVLALTVTRSGGADDGTSGDYEIRVTITPGTTAAAPPAEPTTEAAPPPEPTTETAPSQAYPANVCQSGANAVSGLTSSDHLIDSYMAAGDSYYVDQLERTAVFRTDDDLNAVFRVQNVSDTVTVAGIFCAPDGSYLNAGENSFSNGGPYLLGVDWESSGQAWVTGDWFAELYVNDQLELTLGFTVQ